MSRFTISRKLLTSFLIVVVLMILAGGVAIFGMIQMNSTSSELYEEHTFSLIYLSRVTETLQRIRVYVREMVLSVTAENRAGIDYSYGVITAHLPIMTTNLDSYREKILNDGNNVVQLFDETRRMYDVDLVQVVVAIHAAALVGDMNTIYGLLDQCRDISAVIIGNFEEIMRLKVYEAEKSATGIDTLANGLLIAIALVMVISVIGALTLVRYLSGLIGDPLARSTNSLQQVSESIENAVLQLTESSASIADSSSLQAASIEETSATMQVTSNMVAQTADNTKQAAELANLSKDAADTGKVKMQEMVNAMSQLKESSDIIAKIIKNIDEIAFQTNLLAINATIEAARAGDAGKGFAVVADEVRNLALRSAAAAAETAEIVEKNISLTEASSQISFEVADSLEHIIEQFEGLRGLISDINSSSEEQSSGIRQINIAISQLEDTTQSNAAASEESAASASMLKDLVRDLEEVFLSITAVVYGMND